MKTVDGLNQKKWLFNYGELSPVEKETLEHIRKSVGLDYKNIRGREVNADRK